MSMRYVNLSFSTSRGKNNLMVLYCKLFTYSLPYNEREESVVNQQN